MDVLIKWILLIIFLFIVVILIARAFGVGGDMFGSLCDRTGGWFGC